MIYVVVTGGGYDLFAEVVCRDMAELFAIINSVIRPMPGVASVESFPYFDIRTHRFTWDTETGAEAASVEVAGSSGERGAGASA